MRLVSNRYFLFFVVGLLYLYLILRAIFVPIVHDEAATFFHYIHKGSFLPWFAHWDANNHVVNSAFGSLFYSIFGKSLLVIRLTNLLAFLPFCWFAWKLSKQLKDDFLRPFCFIALISARFVLEFFALSRGYGMSMAFFLGAIWQISLFLENLRPRHLGYGLALLNIAIWSNLSLVNSGFIILTLLAADFLLNRRWITFCKIHYRVVLFAGVLPFLTAVLFSLDLKEKGALYYGSLDGFVTVTVNSLLNVQFFEANAFSRFVVLFLVIGAMLVSLSFWIIKQEKIVSTPLLILLLIAGNVLGSYLMARLLQVNYSEDRVAIYYIPLSILCFSYAVDWITTKIGGFKYAILVLLFFPVSTIISANFNHSVLWIDQSFSEKFYNRIKQENPVASTGCYYLQQMNWAFCNLDQANPANPPQYSGYPSTLPEWQIIYSRDLKKVDHAYEVVLADNSIGQLLLKRKGTLQKKALRSFRAEDKKGQDEFYGLLELTDSIPSDTLFSTISFKLNSLGAPYFNGQLVISANDSTGANVVYDYVPLDWVKTEWDGTEYRLNRYWIDIPKKSKRLVIYIWNIDKQPFEIKDAHVELFSLTENSSFTTLK